MFRSPLQQATQSRSWLPVQGTAVFFEAWHDEQDKSAKGRSQHGYLENSEIESWLSRTGDFKPPDEMPMNSSRLRNGIRLLMCDQTSVSPFGLALSKESMLHLEKHFDIHPATIPSFEIFSGTHSRYIRYEESDSNKISQISMILTSPWRLEIGNYNLSLVFDVATKSTTALLTGEDICIKWENSLIQGLQAFLDEGPDYWHHPLFLPCAILSDYWNHMYRFYTNDLTYNVQVLEQELGVIKVGRPKDIRYQFWNNPSQQQLAAAAPQPWELGKHKVRDLTVSINSQYTEILLSKRPPEWHSEACRFLIELDSMTTDALTKADIPKCRILTEMLEHNITLATSLGSTVATLQSRMDLQLNVLYSFIAQNDNQLNAQLAASAGRDSTSMKILALITVIFLPGTFVATLFSMTMFDWQTNTESNSSGSFVSNRFWIYWTVTIPLTLVTLGGWASWWNLEKKRFDDDLTKAIHGTNKLARAGSKLNEVKSRWATTNT